MATAVAAAAGTSKRREGDDMLTKPSARPALRLRVATALLLALAAAGCATVPDGRPQAVTGPQADPWEAWNRKVFAFNEGLDTHVLKPTATAYEHVVPSFVRGMVTHFFGNLGDAWSMVNEFLQGKPADGFHMLVRFNTNTFFGVGGLFDVATEAGIDRKPEDFGQTLGKWGFTPGPYVVWPIVGPSTFRDSLGLPLDLTATSPSWVIHGGMASTVALDGLNVVDTRANLLGATNVLDQIALDKYSFIRDAYLARRHSQIYDGNPPEPAEDKGDAGSKDDAGGDYAPQEPDFPAPAASAASAP
jgi:phospholipid-binding lipoprotein MlaA